MDHTNVLETVDRYTQLYTDFLKEICSFEATAWDKGTLDRQADYIVEFARLQGFRVSRTPFIQCGDFLTIDLNPGAEKGSVFLAHLDTVHKKGAFGKPAVRIEGDRMMGPGVIDCKGGVAVALLAMQACLNCGYPRHARLILTTDEEVSNTLGGKQELQFIAESVAGFRSALNCEVTGKNQVVVSRKGVLRVRIDIRGRSGHAGQAYFESASAVREAAYKILALEGSSRRDGVTYNCNIQDGNHAANIVPDTCSIIVDIRVRTRKEMEQAESFVREVAKTAYVPGTVSTVSKISARPPLEQNPQTQELFDRLNRLSLELGCDALIPVNSGGGSDSAHTHAAGVPSICGLGPWGEYCHSNREYVELSSIPQRAKLLAAYLYSDL